MNWLVLRFAVAVELLTSFLLYELASTDGVRVWYPSGWAYVGDHGLLWALAFVAVSSVLLGTLKTKWRSDIMTALAAIIAEPISTAYVWFVIPVNSGDISRAWSPRTFRDYLEARVSIWSMLVALAVTYYLYLRSRHGRTQGDSSASSMAGR
jgi:hypothetical protein